MTTLYHHISTTAALDPRRVLDRLRAELDVRGWPDIEAAHADELRRITPASGRGHAAINATIALGAATRMLARGSTDEGGYSLGDRIAQAVMWTAFALLNVNAAEACFEELCARGAGDWETPLREVPITDAERTYVALVLGQRVGDDAVEW